MTRTRLFEDASELPTLVAPESEGLDGPPTLVAPQQDEESELPTMVAGEPRPAATRVTTMPASLVFNRRPAPAAVADPPADGGTVVMEARPTLVRRADGARFALPPVAVVGRGSAPDVAVSSDASVSRRHLTVRTLAGRVLVEDPGSANGTVLNGRALKPGRMVELVDGDVLRLGRAQFDFVADRSRLAGGRHARGAVPSTHG